MTRHQLITLLACLALAFPARGDQPFRYPEGKHGQGELKYINGVPVLMVAGKPEEMGEQIGVLALKHAPQMVEAIKGQVRAFGGDVGWALAVKMANGVYQHFPEEYRQEIEAMARASGKERDAIVVANTIFDLKGIRLQGLSGCAGLAVEPSRSATGGSLFGRNVDTDPEGRITEVGLVIVYRPAGKQPFVLVTFPGVLACSCGMNASGLTAGCNDVDSAADKSPSFNARGVPSLVGQRRILESCKTVAEVEKWLRANPLTIYGIAAVCDLRTAVVFEVTPKTVAVRQATEHVVCATNHFLAKELQVPVECPRLPELEKARQMKLLSVADVAGRLHAANARARTIQTMVFEPKRLKLHVAFGDGKKSATEFKLEEIDLSELLKP